jgi:hypothetical protein
VEVTDEGKIVVGRHLPALQAKFDELVTPAVRMMATHLPAEKLDELRRVHVRRYTNRLRMAEGGIRGVNVEETERLLGLWRGMAGKKFDELDRDQQTEVLDALAAGE